MPRRQTRDDIPRDCVCTEGHVCKRPTAYAAYGGVCWPCRHGTHDLIKVLDKALRKRQDAAIRRKAKRAQKRADEEGKAFSNGSGND